MGKTMTPSESSITAGQIGKIQELLGARLRNSDLPSDLVQQVLAHKGAAIAGEMVKIIRAHVAKLRVLVVFHVTVDYNTSLSEMIRAGKYDYAGPDITAKNFPTGGEGQIDLDLCLVHFDCRISSDKALAELKKMELHPATLPELLALGATYAHEQRKHPIVALGSVWALPDGRRGVPFLGGWSGSRRLDLGCQDRWNTDCRFLAVRA